MTKRSPGRPRSEHADRAILQAATEVLIEKGADRLTVGEVVQRSGVARATIYRRWPTREALIAAAVEAVKGRPPYDLSGVVERDLATGIEWMRATLAQPAFRRYLPYLVGQLLSAGPNRAPAAFHRIAPNHRRVADEYARLAEAEGLRTDVDPLLVSDVVIGTMLARLLSSGRVPSAADVGQVTSILLDGLRRRGSPDAD